MKIAIRSTIALTALLSLCACKPHAPATLANDAPATTDTASSTEKSFDIESVPTSTVALGEFPYITLPAGYSSSSFSTETRDFARFPFWVKGAAHWVEGKMYMATMGAVSGKSMSPYEVRKSFDDQVQQMGGQKVSEEKIPGDAIKSWGEEITVGFVDGLGDIYNDPATTYLIRRDDGNIWIHLSISGTASYVIAREKTLEPTTNPLPAP